MSTAEFDFEVPQTPYTRKKQQKKVREEERGRARRCIKRVFKRGVLTCSIEC